MSKQKIEYVSPMALNADEENPRSISPENFKKLKRSVEKFGMDAQPIIARRENSKIIGGHQRLAAALSLGWTQVPVIFLDISEKEARALNVVMNNEAAQGEFDVSKLPAYVKSISEGADGLDATLTGFDHDQLAEMFDEEEAQLEKVDVTPLPNMAWALIGIPTISYGEIAGTLQEIASLPGVTLKTTVNSA